MTRSQEATCEEPERDLLTSYMRTLMLATGAYTLAQVDARAAGLASEVRTLAAAERRRTDNPPPIKVTAEPPPYCEGADKHDWTVWCRECGAIDDSRAKALDYVPPVDIGERAAVLLWLQRSLEYWDDPGRLSPNGRTDTTGAIRGIIREIQRGDHRTDSVTTPEKKS